MMYIFNLLNDIATKSAAKLAKSAILKASSDQMLTPLARKIIDIEINITMRRKCRSGCVVCSGVPGISLYRSIE